MFRFVDKTDAFPAGKIYCSRFRVLISFLSFYLEAILEFRPIVIGDRAKELRVSASSPRTHFRSFKTEENEFFLVKHFLTIEQEAASILKHAF